MPAKKPRSVTFVSKHLSLRIVRRCAEDRILPNGNVAIVAPEKVYEFHNGTLTLNPGQDVMKDILTTGEEIEQDAISYLRSEPSIQSFFQEVVPPAPPISEDLKEIAKLAARGDLEGLQKLGDAEAEEWARQEVLDAIDDAMSAIEEQAGKAKAAK